MPTRQDIRTVLAAHTRLGSDAIGDDEAVHLDSLALTWLLHVLDERYGLRIEPDDARLVDFTSVAEIERAVNAIAGHA